MPEQAPTLRDMINDALTSGVTYRQLESRAVDPQSGKSASRAVFNDIVLGKIDRMPYDYHLRAIAAGLGVPYERVRQAAIRQWVPPEDGAVDEMPADSRSELIAEYERLRAAILEEARGASADTAEAGGAA